MSEENFQIGDIVIGFSSKYPDSIRVEPGGPSPIVYRQKYIIGVDKETRESWGTSFWNIIDKSLILPPTRVNPKIGLL